MRWPLRVKAQPTLRGLRALPGKPDRIPSEGTLYPWDRVARLNVSSGVSNWVVYDKDGEEITFDGRKLYLSISGARANRVARQAQERHLRRAWREQNWDISEVYEHTSLVPAMIMLAAGALAIGGWAWTMLPSIIRAFEEARSLPMPTSYPILLGICAAAVPIMVLTIWLLFFWLFLRQRKVNVAFAHMAPDGIHAVLRDGMEVIAPWQMLANASTRTGIGYLEFRDGTVLRVPARRRTRVILRILSEATDPYLQLHEHRANRNTILRIGAYMLAGAALAGAAGYYLHRDYQTARGGLIVAIGFAAYLAVAALALVLCLRINGYLNRRRKRTGPAR